MCDDFAISIDVLLFCQTHDQNASGSSIDIRLVTNTNLYTEMATTPNRPMLNRIARVKRLFDFIIILKCYRFLMKPIFIENGP